MKTQEGQPAVSIDSMQPILLKAKTFATSSTGMMLIMGVIALVALQMFGGNKKGKIAREHVRFARGKQGRDEDREFVSGQCRRTYP